MQLNVNPGADRNISGGIEPEVIMLEFYEPGAAIVEQSVADAATRFTTAKKHALHRMFGAQRLILEEFAFGANELIDRTRAETHLFSEFVSKMAGSHSVKDLRTIYEECGQHQIDFIRRDCERLFKHGERIIESTSNLFANHPQD